MKTNKNNYHNYISQQSRNWFQYINNLPSVLRDLNQKTIIAIGVVPYSRLVLGLFLKNYIIFCAKDCKDINLIRKFTRVICVEEKFPKIANKIKSTGYMLKNFVFQNFIKRLNKPFDLSFYTIGSHASKTLDEQNISYFGNKPETQQQVLTKYNFRNLLKELNLTHLKNIQISREKFIQSNFDQIYELFNTSFVCQRGDFDYGGEIATFFIHNQQDFEFTKNEFIKDERFSIVEINPFVNGNSLSMIGCATRHGIFTGSLQTQLIDIKESLRSLESHGTFVGHDFGLMDWSDLIEKEAQLITETIGKYLYKNKYKGIFGIDFIHNAQNQTIYPLECNPRFTGSLQIASLLAIMNGVLPLELLDAIEHKNINAKYNFQKLNNDLKFKSNFSHILITANGIKKMSIDIPIGIYSYNEENDEIIHERPALLPWEIKNNNEFLVVDSVLKQGALIQKGAVKIFKIIFPASIAENSYKLKPKFAKITKIFSDLLHDQV